MIEFKNCKGICIMYNNYKDVERYNEIMFNLKIWFFNIKIVCYVYRD